LQVREIGITRKFNLGNYQTMDIHVEGSLFEGEDVVEALNDLENLILAFWEGRTKETVKFRC